MPKIAKLFALLPLLVGSPAFAGPQLPLQEVNLAILDLNGAPFRQFHLQHYPGAVLDPHAITAPAERHTAAQELMQRIMSDSWKTMPGKLALHLPRQDTEQLEPLLQKERRSTW